MKKIHNSKEDFEKRKVIQIPYCKKCQSSDYMITKYFGEKVCICVKCGNNTFN